MFDQSSDILSTYIDRKCSHSLLPCQFAWQEAEVGMLEGLACEPLSPTRRARGGQLSRIGGDNSAFPKASMHSGWLHSCPTKGCRPSSCYCALMSPSDASLCRSATQSLHYCQEGDCIDPQCGRTAAQRACQYQPFDGPVSCLRFKVDEQTTYGSPFPSRLCWLSS